MARSNQSGRVKVENLTGGLNTLVDPLVGDLRQSPDLANVRVESGLLAQRKGTRQLDREPSSVNSGGSDKGRVSLSFSAASSEYGRAINTSGITLGTKWTVRLEMAFAQASHQTIGNYFLFELATPPGSMLKLYAEGNGSAIRLVLTATDELGTAVTIQTSYKTAAAWSATTSGRFIRVTRDGATINLYVAETLEATTSGFTTKKHSAALDIYLNSDQTPGNHSNSVFYGLTFVNRVLTEEECYWGANFPADPVNEDQQILGNWPAIEGTGTSLKDYSTYTNNLTLLNTPTWAAGTNRFARGLGIFAYRLRDGTKYHVIGASRTALDGSSNAPSGAIYTWVADSDFYPFFFGGATAANDGTASLDELSFLHRMDFQAFRDILYMTNGFDFCRQFYLGTWGYLGGTAPHVAPVATDSGSGSSWRWVQTWFNPSTKKDTAASPYVELTDAGSGSSIQTWVSSDAQFTKARVWRTLSGGTVYYLAGEVAAGASFTDTISDADLRKQQLLHGPDGSLSGNYLVKRSYIPGGPATAPSLASGGAGNVNAGTHYWAYAWRNSTTGAESGMSAAASIVVAGGGESISVTNLVLPPSGTDFDQTVLYRTKAGAFLWYQVGNAFTAATSTTDNTADSSLTTTIETKSLPPKSSFMCPFAGRVFYGGDPDNRGTGWWSSTGVGCSGEDVTWTSGHDPNPGAELVAYHATQFNLFWHYSDGKIFVMDHPGPEPALEQFVPFNLRLWSDHGAAVSHFSIQKTPLGTIWLGDDGFYREGNGGPENIAPTITPDFLDLNLQRIRYACSLYDKGRMVYRCWVSRGNKRYNEECFVLDLRNLVWCLDDAPHADAAGILRDGKEFPHYVALGENGVLVEFVEQDYDGDGTGTLSGAVAGATMISFTDIGGRVAPTGEDSGYPIWLKNDSSGVLYQRFVISPGLGIVGSKVNFVPSLKDLESGSWTVYFHGIRGRWKSMMLDYGDRRYDKSLGDFYLYHGEETVATSLAVTAASAEGTLASIGTITLNNGDNRGVIERTLVDGRVFQIQLDHNPPTSGRSFRIVGFEFNTKLAGDNDS